LRPLAHRIGDQIADGGLASAHGGITAVERDSGRQLSGGPDEATEAWTFMRGSGGHWILSAIQQA